MGRDADVVNLDYMRDADEREEKLLASLMREKDIEPIVRETVRKTKWLDDSDVPRLVAYLMAHSAPYACRTRADVVSEVKLLDSIIGDDKDPSAKRIRLSPMYTNLSDHEFIEF